MSGTDTGECLVRKFTESEFQKYGRVVTEEKDLQFILKVTISILRNNVTFR